MKNDKIIIINRSLEISEIDIWEWYLNIELELEHSFLNMGEKKYLSDYYYEAGLLRSWRRPFFKHHYARTFTKAVNFVLPNKEQPVILDLGCGTGTQSLCFALLGARVIAVDMDSQALSIFKKRVIFYEEKSGRNLNISIYESNIFTFNLSDCGLLDGIYSLFAFNMMMPAEKLLDILAINSKIDCRIAILDGNNQSWLGKIIPSRRRDQCLSPKQLTSALEKRNFAKKSQIAGFSIPPFLWYILPKKILNLIDTYLGKNSFFAISYQSLFYKKT